MREEMDREFFVPLPEGSSLRVRIEIDRGEVARFVVQLEYTIGDDRWLPVVRYDSAHGRPHRDILNPGGETIKKEWLDELLGRDVSMAEGLNYGQDDLKKNWRAYRDTFLEMMP
ncbi:MAG: hypothetical protein LC793_06345 [Thermomicrobia bacterium]|nr:hypothetical protein [Thermomicrobia bacterium]